jgi:Zn finger protein HypA/HybF involved in hydrogenase expression
VVEVWNHLCPKCGSSDWDVWDSYNVDGYEWTEIRCNECNHTFGLKTIQILCDDDE